MAELFLARSTGVEGFEKLVVVKRILPLYSSDPTFVKMFVNEAHTVARLNHPNIVQIFDLGRINDQYFIAMEFVHGEDTRKLVKQIEQTRILPSPALVCRIVADVLAGLHYAHTRTGADRVPLGIVHRDVSPQNIIVTYEGTVKLVDFGIAKVTRGINAEQTQAGFLKGKFSYMSPEQARGRAVDARTDVFAAGIIMWELLALKRLFKRPTEMETLLAVAEEPGPSLMAINPDVPIELEQIVQRALEKQADKRYATAEQMRSALEGLIRKKGWEADSLALSSYMQKLFHDKLEAQQADVHAAGYGTLEDFLLQVEEKSQIKWIDAPTAIDKRTPSVPMEAATASSTPAPIPKSTDKLPAPLTTVIVQSSVPAQAHFPSLGLGRSEAATTIRPKTKRRSRTTWQRLRVIVGVVILAGVAFVLWDSPPKSGPALLDVRIDSPATISIDGKVESLSVSREIPVTPGVDHQIVLERPGEPARKMDLPKLRSSQHVALRY